MRYTFNARQSRRRALKRLGAVAGAGLAFDTGFLAATGTASAHSDAANSLNHVLIACQENRSFDQYFGFYPGAGSFGVPADYAQPDGNGGFVTPHHYPLPYSNDVPHTWQAIHSEWNNGAMDGFYTTDGIGSLGYFDGFDIPFYYALASQFTLCGNYFCYLLGPSLPNCLGLYTGTSGGITTENVSKGSLDWPTIADLLDQYGVSWKCYNLGLGTGSSLEDFNGLTYFKKWKSDSRLYLPESAYYHDLNNGTLPQVSFLITEALISEHPPTDIQWGQSKMKHVITALMASRAWYSSVLFLTYDEGGGYFDHVPPPQLDAYGPGFRVPMLVISPYAQPGYVSGQLYEHASILKFIERRFGLPSLASINHQFDAQTPGLNNDAAQGQAYGPPAPPRDGYYQIGDFYEILNF